MPWAGFRLSIEKSLVMSLVRLALMVSWVGQLAWALQE
jgi:hypothetical protein